MVRVKNKEVNYIKFLGTAGARFVMIKQLRASGGLWVSCGETNILIDPGPGSIVRCASSRPKLDPGKLDAIILTHRHLDHANDINVMIEAMTEGGFKKRGVVFCPSDALGDDPVILRHARSFPGKIQVIRANHRYKVGDFRFTTSMRHIHPCQTYGLKFKIGSTSIGLITDTRYFPGLAGFYKTDVLIIAVVLYELRQGIDHLSLKEAGLIINQLRPKKAVLTHFGMSMLKAGPVRQAEILSGVLGIEVIAAYDGMKLEF
ncbi:MAG: MBL fold metallo-hydrolase [Candidatus Omnitrophica bacterium]|nr:MBL fold metallo-hydrolase [Candidatus Omnitrophota bacterium]